MITINTQEELEALIVNGQIIIDDDLTITCDVSVKTSIKAWDIDGMNIKAWGIDGWSLDALSTNVTRIIIDREGR